MELAELSAGRLLIRPFCAGELTPGAPFCGGYLGDECVMRWLEPPMPSQRARAFLLEYGVRRKAVYALVWKETAAPPDGLPRVAGGALAGHVIFHPAAGRPGFSELGWVLDRRVWRRGLGRESGLALIRAARGAGEKGLCAEAAPDNTASCGLLEALGFQPCGRDEDGLLLYEMYF